MDVFVFYELHNVQILICELRAEKFSIVLLEFQTELIDKNDALMFDQSYSKPDMVDKEVKHQLSVIQDRSPTGHFVGRVKF